MVLAALVATTTVVEIKVTFVSRYHNKITMKKLNKSVIIRGINLFTTKGVNKLQPFYITGWQRTK